MRFIATSNHARIGIGPNPGFPLTPRLGKAVVDVGYQNAYPGETSAYYSHKGLQESPERDIDEVVYTRVSRQRMAEVETRARLTARICSFMVLLQGDQPRNLDESHAGGVLKLA
jgi:hypothetical protein